MDAASGFCTRESAAGCLHFLECWFRLIAFGSDLPQYLHVKLKCLSAYFCIASAVSLMMSNCCTCMNFSLPILKFTPPLRLKTRLMFEMRNVADRASEQNVK